MSPAEISKRIERAWDAVAAHLARHPRKYAALGFFVIFLPRTVPNTWRAAEWLWDRKPAWVASLAMPGFSWDWVSVPVGTLFMALVWLETRKHRAGQQRSKQLAVLQAYPDRNTTNPKLKFPLKLRVQLKNNFGEAISVRDPKWVRGSSGWPASPPTIIRLRRTWRDPDEGILQVPTDGEFILWVVLDPTSIADDDIRRRHTQGQLATIAVTVRTAGGSEHEVHIAL
jgi:hypothetical protein